MEALRKWFEAVSFGQKKRYGKFVAWMYFDSLVASIPYTVLMMAIWFLMEPVLSPQNHLKTASLWLLVGILAVQTLTYLLIRRKTYWDVCVGNSQSLAQARLSSCERLKELPMGFFTTQDAGRLTNIIMQDYDMVEQTASLILVNISVIVLRMLLFTIVMICMDVRMVLAMLLVVGLAVPFAVLSYKRLNHSGSELTEIQLKTSSIILEYVSGIRTLKAFNRAGETFETLKDKILELKDLSKKQERAGAPVSMVGRAILYLGIASVMYIGGKLYIQGELTAFFFVICMLAALSIYEPLTQLMVMITVLARANLSIKRIATLKAQKPLMDGTVTKALNDYGLTIEEAHFSYEAGKEILKGVNLEIPNKSVVALVGLSGSGKSTITRLIARFYDLQKGEIQIGKVSIKDMPQKKLLSMISMVFQDVYLFHDTIYENIKMGKEDASYEEVVEAAKKAGCHDFIMQLPEGYDTMVGEGGCTLSGGEKQRISIARAILKDAPIVLLDEATASLDPENEVLVQRAISTLAKEKTVVVIAHRLSSVMNADKIVVLEDGRIKEEGTHEALLHQDGVYAKLWSEQCRAGEWKMNS